MPAPLPGARSWRRLLAPADAVFLFAVAALAPTMAATNLRDPGLGWHLRNIDAMVEAGGWLHLDPFSQATPAATWYTNQWIGDLALWLGWHWAGWNGLAAVGLIVLGLTCRWLFDALSEDGVPWPVAAAWTVAAMLGSSMGWAVRPNLVTPLFVLVTVRLCSRFHDGLCPKRALLALLPLFALWANTHGGFFGGLATLFAALTIEAVLSLLQEHPDERAAARERAGFLALVTSGAVLATFVNPYGWKLYPWAVNLVTSNLNILDEWKAPDFNWTTWTGAARYELFVLLFPALMALSRWRPGPVATGLSLLWLHQALQARRFMPVWVIATTPLLARASLELPWIGAVAARIPLSPDFRAMLARPCAPAPRWTVALLCAAVFAGARLATPIDMHDEREAAMHQLLALNDGRTVIFHDANWGGALTWQGWDRSPRFRTWIDDRYEVQGDARYGDYLRIRDARPGWETDVARLGLEIIAVDAGWPIVDRLAADPGWESLHRDDHAAIFRRLAPAGVPK